MRHILILFFCLFIGSLYGQIVRVDSTVIYESRSIYNQAGYYIGKDSFHVKQVRLAYCNDTFFERNDTLIQRFPQQFITSDSVDADITEVNVTNYLTGGGSSGAVTIGIDTSGTVGVATKYDVGTKIDGSGAYPFLARFTDSNTLASSVISDDGTGAITVGNGDGGIDVNYSTGFQLQKADEKHGVITSSGNGVIVGYNTYNDLTLINVDSNAYFIDLGGSGLSSIGTVIEGVYVNKIDASNTESNLLTIKDNGYIGIGGVTEPDATLHVDGTLKVTSQTGTPTKILGVDASGNVGEVGKGFGISVSGGDVLVDTTKIATQYDIKDFQTGLQVRDSIGALDSNHDGKADDASKFEGQGGSYYLNRANHTGTQDTSTISGLGEFVEDRAGAKIVAGTNITTSYNDATGETTINATGGSGGLSAEEVRDTVAAMFTTGSSITWNETDSADSIFLDVNLNPLETMVQRNVMGENYFFFVAQGSTSIGGFGFNTTGSGSTNVPTLTTTNKYTKRIKLEWNQNTPSTSNAAGVRGATAVLAMGEGFIYSIKWGPTVGMSNTSKRAFTGLRASTGAPTDVAPNTLTDMIGMGWDDANDTNVKLYHNDGSGTATEIDLGSNFPIPTSDRTDYYTLTIYVEPGGTTVNYKVTDETDDNVVTGVITSNIPSTSTFLNFSNYTSVGGVSATTGWALFSAYGQVLD